MTIESGAMVFLVQVLVLGLFGTRPLRAAIRGKSGGRRQKRGGTAAIVEPDSTVNHTAWQQGQLRRPPPGRTRLLQCVVVFAVGLGARVFFLLFSSFESGDQPDYTAIAANLVRHGTFAMDLASPTIFRPPGYPFFIAGIYALFGERNQLVLVIQSLLGAAAGVLLYLWLRKLVSARSAGLCAVLVAAYPHLNFYAGTILAETLLAAILVTLVYCLYRSQEELGSTYTILTGFLAAATVLITPRMIAVPLLAAVSLVVAARRSPAGVRKGLACLFVSTVTLLPWTIRNLAVFGIPTPSAVQYPGTGLWLSAQRVTVYDYKRDELEDDPLYRRFKELYSEPASERARMPERQAFERVMSRAAVATIRADPLSYLIDRARNYPRLWIQPAMYAGYFHPPFTAHNRGLQEMLARRDIGAATVRIVLTLVFVATPALLVLVGLVATRYEWRRHLFVYLLFAWTAISLAPFLIEHRYSVVIHPLLALFCARALDYLGAGGRAIARIPSLPVRSAR